MLFTTIRCAVVFALLADVALAADAPPGEQDWCVSPQQNRELLKKAWQAPVTVKFTKIKFDDAFADVARQSGLAISVSPDCKTFFRTGSRRSSTPSNLRFWNWEIQPHQAIGWVQEYKLKGITNAGAFSGDSFEELTLSGPVPAAVALTLMADFAGMGVSYRKDGIYIAPNKEIDAERCLTRHYALKHAWGSIQETYTAEGLIKKPLSLLETVSDAITCRMGPESDKNCVHIDFDAKSKEVTITAPQRAIYCFETIHLPGVDRPSPGELQEDLLTFRKQRMEELAAAEWAKLDDAARARITSLVKTLDNDDFKTRKTAADELVRSGPVALKPLLDLHPPASNADLTERLPKLNLRVYSEYECAQILATANAYLKAGTAGEIGAIHDKFLGSERLADFEKDRKAFDAEFAEIRADAEAVKGFLAGHDMVPGTPVDKISYDERLRQSMRVREPRVERIQLVGRHARIAFSSEVPEDHPHKEFQRSLQIARPVSDVYLVFENGRWVAGPYVWEVDARWMLEWLPKSGLSGSELEKVEATSVSTPETESMGVSAYSISFGF